MARPNRTVKVKSSFKRCSPRRIRIVYDDPEATDSSADEGGKIAPRRRTVQEFRLASRPHSTPSASSTSSPIPAHLRFIRGARAWSWKKRAEGVTHPIGSGGFWLGSGSPQVEAIVICGAEKEACASNRSSVENIGAGGGKWFPSPSSMFEASAVGSALLVAAYDEEVPRIRVPEQTAAQGSGPFLPFGFESCPVSCDWISELWFTSPRPHQRAVEWASTDEVENFFC